MNLYFAEPDSSTQLRRWLATGKRWLESEDAIAPALPDPCAPTDIAVAIELTWRGGWNGFVREQRRREIEAVLYD